jgi:hypothetical protein
MAIWILGLMQLLVPHAPYSDTFSATAAAIDKVAHEAPLYEGEDGVAETAAELVALTFHESTFDPNAVGGDGTTIGLAQIHVSNLPDLGITRAQLFEPEANLRAALKLIRDSHRFCRKHPKDERLANYASGGTTCSVPAALRASRFRMHLAARLLRAHPVRWTEIDRPLAKRESTIQASAP